MKVRACFVTGENSPAGHRGGNLGGERKAGRGTWAHWGRWPPGLRPAVPLPSPPSACQPGSFTSDWSPPPPPPSSGLLLGKAAIGSLFLKSSFKHTVCSPEICLCLQRSRKLILAAQGSVLIFADFTHLLLAVYLAVFEHSYGLG